MLKSYLQSKPEQFYGLTQIPEVVFPRLQGGKSSTQLKLGDEWEIALWHFSTRDVMRNSLMAASSLPGCSFSLASEESWGISPRLESDYGQALLPWMKMCKIKGCAQRSFSTRCWTSLLLCGPEVEWDSMQDFWSTTKRWHWVLQPGLELVKRKWWWRTVSVKILNRISCIIYPLRLMEWTTPNTGTLEAGGLFVRGMCGTRWRKHCTCSRTPLTTHSWSCRILSGTGDTP